MLRPLFIACLPFVILAGCAEPTPPSITVDDIAAAEAEFNRVSALPVIALADRPTSTVSYSGKLSGPVIVDGESGYAIQGDLAMNVNFGLSSAVSGSLGNINLIDNGIPDQRLGGNLTLLGSTSGTTVSSTITGQIDAVGEDVPFRGTSDVRLNLSGDVRQDAGTATAIVGSWTGGSVSPDTDDFDISGTGGFFATSN